MIGIIKGEDTITFEFWPFFAKRIPKWSHFHIKYSCRYYGEFGVAWSWSCGWLPTIWISTGLSTYNRIKLFLRDLVKGNL